MKIKSIVKVMSFHSLLKVDKARKKAEKYFEYEKELTDFADNIMNNRNLILDKKMLKLNKNAKPLNIYIGNDLGFCGNFNTNVNKKAIEEKDCDKIIIGKKILKGKENVLLAITKEKYLENPSQLEPFFYDAIKKEKNNEINIIYNHYQNISQIEFVKKKILPLDKEAIKSENSTRYKEDFVVEGDINEILLNIIILYLTYEVKVATENSYASENVMRQMLTKESLKKIDEIEEQQKMEERKEINDKSFKKVIENFIKLKDKEGE